MFGKRVEGMEESRLVEKLSENGGMWWWEEC